jgi:hypothetical protein
MISRDPKTIPTRLKMRALRDADRAPMTSPEPNLASTLKEWNKAAKPKGQQQKIVKIDKPMYSGGDLSMLPC